MRDILIPLTRYDVVEDSVIILARKGRCPPAEQFRLNNEDQLVIDVSHSAQSTLEFLSTLCARKPCNLESTSLILVGPRDDR